MTALKLPPFKSLQPLWQALSPRRRKQLLGLQLLSVVAAGGEVANLGALLPFLRLLANPSEGLKALGPLAAQLRGLPQLHLLLGLGIGFMAVVITSSLLRVITIRTQLRLASLIAADLGEQVFAAVLQKPFAWHLQHNSSSVLGHLTKDVDQTASSIQAMALSHSVVRTRQARPRRHGAVRSSLFRASASTSRPAVKWMICSVHCRIGSSETSVDCAPFGAHVHCRIGSSESRII